MQHILTNVGGAIDVTLDIVEGLPTPHVALTFRPQTVEECDRIVELLGGASAFQFPDGAYWAAPAYRHGEDRMVPAVLVYPPPATAVVGVSQQTSPVPHPFFGRYAEKKEGL